MAAKVSPGLRLLDGADQVLNSVTITDAGTLSTGTSGTVTFGASTAATFGANSTLTMGATSTISMGAGSYMLHSAVNALTATVGGAQAGTALTGKINRVTTVASAADSVQLPAALAGREVVVVNSAAANAMAVFPQTGEIINALSANASISVAANKTIMFFCAVAGTWNSILTA